MLRIYFLSLCISVTLMSLPTFAQAPIDDQKVAFKSFILSKVFQDNLGKAIKNMTVEPQPLRAQCSSLQAIGINDSYITVKQPVMVMTASGVAMQQGAWISIVQVDRCGQKVKRRILFVKKSPSEPFQMVGLVPGDFHGNLKLEMDTIGYAKPAAAAALGCTGSIDVTAIDTQELVPMTPQGGADIWTFWGCDKTVQMKVTYTAMADGRGMDIIAQKYTSHDNK